jgi:hypothetical protein
MHERTLTRTLFTATAAATSAFLLYAYTHPVSAAPSVTVADAASDTNTTPGATPGTGASLAPAPATATASAPTIDISTLLHPAGKYLGLAQDGVPDSMTGLARFTKDFGAKPGIVAYYAPWGAPLNQTWILNLTNDGVLPLIQFEPTNPTIAQIAAGASDSYATELATTIKALNVPVVVSFGHEMNGDWFTWGTRTTRPADFVAAWRRIHDIFTTVGATDVIWLWDANVTYPVPDIPLKPLYPGDAYVDWIGLTGYYNTTAGGRRTFETLFGPTMDQVRGFSTKPFLIAETAAAPSPEKPEEIRDLFAGVADRADVLGFVWFNYTKTGIGETDWKIDSDPASAATFRSLAGSYSSRNAGSR